MKHLKYFESKLEDIQIIKDVFQDLIDDWDLELTNGYQNWIAGNYIMIKYVDKVEAVRLARYGSYSKLLRTCANHCKQSDDDNIIVNILKVNDWGGWVEVSTSAEFKRDVEDHIKKLRNMGYDVVDMGVNTPLRGCSLIII